MSQNPQKHSDYSDYIPKIERRVPLPITNLPVNALTDDLDPTREIRTLIEQLQQVSRDARTHARSAQQEKEDLAAQLEDALLQIEQLRIKERESRAQFVEITSLIHERDAALEEAERHRQAASEFQHKLDTAARERNDAQRQREDFARRQAEAAKATQEALAKVGEAQKQLLSVRQARDAANAQNLALSDKISRAEDEVAELSYQREAAQKTQKKIQDEHSDLRRQLATVTGDRDATAAQVQELNDQLDESRKKLLDLAEQKSAVLESDNQHSAALAEARQQVTAITAERDAARLRGQEQVREMELLSAQLTELHAEHTALSAQAGELDDLRRQLASLSAERERHEVHEQRLAEETASQQSRITELAEQLTAAEQAREQAVISLEATQRQVEQLTAEHATDREEGDGRAAELADQLATLRSQVAGLEQQLDAATQHVEELSGSQAELRVLTGRFEKQRVATIDLGARLEAAQREIMELSANLAEARLAARFATSRAKETGAKSQPDNNAGSSFEVTLDSIFAAADSFDADTAAALAPDIHETLDEKSAKGALGAMRHCFQSFQKNSSDLSLLNELYSHAYGFSERARVSGYIALHRLCGAFAHFAHGLYEVPESVSPSTLRTLNQTIEFLIALMKDRNLAQIQDPAKALIYIVDDDADNCEAIKLAMETAMLRTTCAQDPVLALAELESGCFDLIFLDVNLPGMNGFELCAHIRQVPAYAKTPIMFLTGLTTVENRVQSSLSGGSDFIGKPFNLHELTVKALTFIMRAQLKMD
jgi:CheY-like chemotaxis protein/myosin heavy subunit